MINLFISLLLFLFPLVSHAAGFLDSVRCINSGVCGLDDIALGFNALIKLLLGLMGAVSLLYFIWGGILWISSAGNAEKVSRGKNIMINTILAIFVAFSSFLILDLFINKLLGAKSTGQVTAECADASSDGRACNTAQENYVCYDGSCVTECDELNAKVKKSQADPFTIPDSFVPGPATQKTIKKQFSLACEQVAYTNMTEVCHLVGYCPGDENFVCVLRDAGGAVKKEPCSPP